MTRIRAILAGLVVAVIGGQRGLGAEAGSGNLRYTVTVSKFANEANWRGRWDLGHGFETIMTDRLYACGRFVVLGAAEMRNVALAEQDFAASGRVAGGKKAPKMGRMTPAQLLVRGSITHVQETAGGKGGLSFKGISLGGGAGQAEINMTIYLVDSETGQVKASKDVVGKSTNKGLGVGYHGSALGGLTGNLSGFLNDNLGKACSDAVDQCIQFMVGQLDGIPWEGTILLVSGGKIVVNRGSREGVAVGMKFDAGSAAELVDPDTGEVLASEMTKVATLVVTEVKEKIAYCEAGAGGGKLEKGMAVFPAK
ncbi:MAG: CsgG/HfaB family protein [Lentisphaeria bacterium]|jgi:curli biogenesis system outer membrane secretion channel CsgG